MPIPGLGMCYLCGRKMPPGDRNYFDASGIMTCLVCPKDDPSGKKLAKALAERANQNRQAIEGGR